MRSERESKGMLVSVSHQRKGRLESPKVRLKVQDKNEKGEVKHVELRKRGLKVWDRISNRKVRAHSDFLRVQSLEKVTR